MCTRVVAQSAAPKSLASKVCEDVQSRLDQAAIAYRSGVLELTERDRFVLDIFFTKFGHF
jgi:hypothetical protein